MKEAFPPNSQEHDESSPEAADPSTFTEVQEVPSDERTTIDLPQLEQGEAPKIAELYMTNDGAQRDKAKTDQAGLSVIDVRSLPRNSDGTLTYEGHTLNGNYQYLLLQAKPDWDKGKGFIGLSRNSPTEIGREMPSAMQLDLDESVSDEHVLLVVDERGDLTMQDLRSANGTSLLLEPRPEVTAELPLPDTELSPGEESEQERGYTDKEILGSSKELSLKLFDKTKDAMNSVGLWAAKTKNTFSTPKNIILEMRRDKAMRRYQRKQAKVGKSYFKFINHHYQKVADKYKKKYDQSVSIYDAHSKHMTGRLETARQSAKERQEAYQKKIDFYVNKKIEAERRKQERALRDKLKNDGLSHRERYRYIRDLSPADKRQITDQAIAAIKRQNEQEQATKDRLTGDY